MENYNLYFATFVAFITIIPMATEWFKSIFKLEGLKAQIVSWTIGLFLAMIGWFLQLGIFETTWYYALIIGFGGSLVTNGIFDTGLVTWLLQAIGVLSVPTPLKK